ncbi:MAG: prolipoprotein diacylglyceryl transferase [bacterium]|nr:prolipoprotein diacylglyceryl transferase [bacterium]
MDFNLSPYLFQIGDFGVRYYALMYLLGLLITYLWLAYVAKYDKEKILDLCLWAFIVLVISGRLGFVLFYEPQWIWEDPLQIFKAWEGGRSFHGAFIGTMAYILYFLKKEKWNIMKFGDDILPPIALAVGLGRIGNFLNGEIWGFPTTVPWCFYVPGYEGCLHPAQLYNALANFIVFGILYFLWKRPHRIGSIAGWYFILEGFGRAFTETLWRIPDWVFLGITAGTWLSVPMVLIGLVMIGLAYRKKH